MEQTASSMMKISVMKKSKGKKKKKSVRSINDWINGLRDTKAPPRPKSKGKKKNGKGKIKGKSIKEVANKLREKFIKKKKKAASSKKKKKPISKSRSKAKGKGKRGKTVKKSKTPGKKLKKPKKSKTAKKKKKKVVKKKKKPEQEPEQEPEVHTEMIMLGGNEAGDQENLMMNMPKNIQFQQELKVEPEEPEVINLKMQLGGEIDREDQVEAGTVFPKDKNVRHFELENNPARHLEYNTGEVKLEFGPEDQIIEHIFTMHWSQVDKILIRAKVAENVAPPSKRMTILEEGRDIYSKQRNKIYGEDNVKHMIAEGIHTGNNPNITDMKILNMGANDDSKGNHTQGQIENMVTELVLGGASRTDHMVVLDSRDQNIELKSSPMDTNVHSNADNKEITYLNNKKLDGGLLNNFVKAGGQSIKRKIVNGKLQVEFDSKEQNQVSPQQNQNLGIRQFNHKMGTTNKHDQPISFNNNRVQLDKPKFNSSHDNKAEIRNKLYSNRNRTNNRQPHNYGIGPSDNSFWRKYQNPDLNSLGNVRNTFDSEAFQNAQQYNNMMYGDNDVASNLILKPQFMQSHLDSNHTLRANFHARQNSRPTSVRSQRARTADTLNRRFYNQRNKPMHVYTRFQPSMSKYEHDLIRSQASLSKHNSLEKNFGVDGMVYGIPYGKYRTADLNTNQNDAVRMKNISNSQMERGAFKKARGLNNIYSFSNLRPASQNQANRGSRRKFSNSPNQQQPIFVGRDPSATLRKAYVKYPSNIENSSTHQNPRGLGYNNNFLYTNRPVSATRSHHDMGMSRNHQLSPNARMMHMSRVNGRSNILAMFFRKILVFNSKLESLKQKLFAPNSGFDCPKLFRDFARENPERVSMEELMSFFQSLEFNYSPQIVYKILLYLTRKDHVSEDVLNKASTSKQFELTGSGRLMEVLKQRFNSMANSKTNNRFPKPNPSTSDLLDYSKFESFFSPMKESGTVLSDETIERSMQGVRNHENFLNKEALFHLIRQIVILSLRKLEDLGWVIRSLRLFPPEHLFQLLGADLSYRNDSLSKSQMSNNTKDMNLTSVNKIDQNKIFFGNNKKMKNSLTFQNIPQSDQMTEDNRESTPKKARSNLLNQFLGTDKSKNLGQLKEMALHRFLKENGVDFLTGDLVFIFKELGSFSDRISFDQFSGYLTADLWSL